MAARCLTASALIVAAALYAGPAHAQANTAQANTGRTLLQYCTATIGAYVMFCYGYIDLIVDDLHGAQNVDGYTACVPDGLEDNQRRSVVVDFLGRNPQMSNLDATSLIARSMSEAYPCR